MSKLNINRRNFLKAAGVTTAVGAAAAATAVAVPTIAKAEYDQPSNLAVNLAITYLDNPPYMYEPFADSDKLAQFSSDDNAFGNAELAALYDGNTFAALTGNAVTKALNGVEGWSLRDMAFTQGAWASAYDIPLNWTGSRNYQAVIDVQGPWDQGETQNSLDVKKVAAYLGAGATGICKLNTQWLYYQSGGIPIQYIEADEPVKGPDAYIIPNTMTNVVVMLVPLDGTLAQYAPTGFNPVNGKGYSDFTQLTNKVAGYIRQLGWNAIPLGNDTALSIPLALDAGLGELGRHGLLINPEYGSLCKICKVITDMPLAADKPITFGAAQFCKNCGKCAETCPSKSISTEEEPSYEALALSNNPGMKKWYVNTDSCYKFWIENGADGCNACAKCCTYSKQQTWVHDVIKLIASKTTMFNSIFAQMDDAFGYGAVWEDQEAGSIEAWWDDTSFTRIYDWTRHTY